MDEFKIIVTVALLVSLAALGAVIFIAQDAVNNAKIPDVERGIVISKAPVSDNHPANYTVNLSENRAFYILNNPSLYESIQENQTYLFGCRIDLNNKITLIESATLIPAPAPNP
jgi:hypothetical protein